MTQSTADMLYDNLRNVSRMLDEIWDAIDGTDCEKCDGSGETNTFLLCEDEQCDHQLSEMCWGPEECEACEGEGTIHTYEGSDAREYLEEMPLEIVWEKGEPFAVVLGTGGPHIEIRGGTRHDGSGYAIHGYWAGEHSTWGSEGVGRTGEYFREQVEETNEATGVDRDYVYGQGRY